MEIEEKLIESARTIIKKRFREGYHHVGSSLITKSGKVFSAVHIEANVGRVTVCAEAIAIGMAAAEGDTEIDIIVAVNELGEMVSPCGMCRELISDYSPDAKVIIQGVDKHKIVPINELLPSKYKR